MAKSKSWARSTVGASSKQRWKQRAAVLDGYSTPKIAVTKLMEYFPNFGEKLWEPAAGLGAISKVLLKIQPRKKPFKKYRIFTSDIKKWSKHVRKKRDFLKLTESPISDCDIITNPPFKSGNDFVRQSMNLLQDGKYAAFLLRVQFLEGQARYDLFKEFPPVRVFIFSFRLPRMHQFFYKGAEGSSVLAFAWFVFQKGYKGPTVIEWIKKDRER